MEGVPGHRAARSRGRPGCAASVGAGCRRGLARRCRRGGDRGVAGAGVAAVSWGGQLKLGGGFSTARRAGGGWGRGSSRVRHRRPRPAACLGVSRPGWCRQSRGACRSTRLDEGALLVFFLASRSQATAVPSGTTCDQPSSATRCSAWCRSGPGRPACQWPWPGSGRRWPARSAAFGRSAGCRSARGTTPAKIVCCQHGSTRVLRARRSVASSPAR